MSPLMMREGARHDEAELGADIDLGDLAACNAAAAAKVHDSGGGGGGGAAVVNVMVDSNAAAQPQAKAEPDYSLVGMCKSVALSSKLNVLYAFVPVAFLCVAADAGPTPVFLTSFLALVPLAAILGDLTEDVALRTNEAIGALINVTFGNATEVIISIAALRAKEYMLIKHTLMGSIIGNMLLVLGSALVVGGIRNPKMTFNHTAASTYASTLLLAAFMILVPSIYGTINDDLQYNIVNATGAIIAIKAVENDSKYTLRVSQQTAVVVLLTYILYLYFQLRSHKHLFDSRGELASPVAGGGFPSPASEMVELVPAPSGSSNHHRSSVNNYPPTNANAVTSTTAAGDAGDDEDEETPKFTFAFGVVAIGVAAVLISFLSGFLVDTVEPAAEALRISKHFIALTALATIGNVAEHCGAITMAWKGKLDISLGISTGSSIQIAMCAMPFMVLLSWALGLELDMRFSPFLAATLFGSVVLTYGVVGGGSATWLSGGKLLAAYAALNIAFLNAPDKLGEA